MTSHSSDERRQHPRLFNHVPVKITQEDGDLVTETRNISRSGVYFRVNKYIEPMTKLKLNLLLPIRKKGKGLTKKLCCEGIIVRAVEAGKGQGFDIAVFFNSITQRDAECIADYVTSHLELEQET